MSDRSGKLKHLLHHSYPAMLTWQRTTRNATRERAFAAHCGGMFPSPLSLEFPARPINATITPPQYLPTLPPKQLFGVVGRANTTHALRLTQPPSNYAVLHGSDTIIFVNQCTYFSHTPISHSDTHISYNVQCGLCRRTAAAYKRVHTSSNAVEQTHRLSTSRI